MPLGPRRRRGHARRPRGEPSVSAAARQWGRSSARSPIGAVGGRRGRSSARSPVAQTPPVGARSAVGTDGARRRGETRPRGSQSAEETLVGTAVGRHGRWSARPLVGTVRWSARCVGRRGRWSARCVRRRGRWSARWRLSRPWPPGPRCPVSGVRSPRRAAHHQRSSSLASMSRTCLRVHVSQSQPGPERLHASGGSSAVRPHRSHTAGSTRRAYGGGPWTPAVAHPQKWRARRAAASAATTRAGRAARCRTSGIGRRHALAMASAKTYTDRLPSIGSSSGAVTPPPRSCAGGHGAASGR
jgi:hypothetical protein